jgi:hypothetical protein
MMTNRGVRLYVALFLLWCVLSSKHILIYNEETLVALSFFIFVYLVHRYAGDSFGASLDSRGEEIANEMEQFLTAREESLEILKNAHLSTVSLGSNVVKLGNMVEHNLKSITNLLSVQVSSHIFNSIEARCNNLVQVVQGDTPRLLNAMSDRLPALVLLEAGEASVSQSSLKQALEALA